MENGFQWAPSNFDALRLRINKRIDGNYSREYEVFILIPSNFCYSTKLLAYSNYTRDNPYRKQITIIWHRCEKLYFRRLCWAKPIFEKIISCISKKVRKNQKMWGIFFLKNRSLCWVSSLYQSHLIFTFQNISTKISGTHGSFYMDWCFHIINPHMARRLWKIRIGPENWLMLNFTGW